MLALLAGGWLLSLTRRGVLCRALVAASVPVGALLGAGGGWTVGWLCCRLESSSATRHEWIGLGAAAMFGLVVGVILLPTMILAITGRKEGAK